MSETKYSKISFDNKKVYEVAIIANTSSGKSTVINAIVGKKLLMSKNKPCTAKNIKIVDNDSVDGVIAHILSTDGKYSKLTGDVNELINQYNLSASDEKIADLILECNFQGIENLKKSVALVDTPGPNNSLDKKHSAETINYLEHMTSGLVLYVFDATQIGTYDDRALLQQLYNKVSNNKDIKMLFVINKIDEIDKEKEDPIETVKECLAFVTTIGFKDVDLFCVSAEAALTFKDALAGRPLSENELDNFPKFYHKYRGSNYEFNELFVSSGKMNTDEQIEVDGKIYTRFALKSALNNTGITQLEDKIEEKLIEALRYTPAKLKKIKAEKSTGSIYFTKKIWGGFNK